MAREVLRSSAWVLTVSVGTDVSYELAPTEPGDKPQVRIVVPGDSVDHLCSYLATIGGVRAAGDLVDLSTAGGAVVADLSSAGGADLVELSTAAARRADLGRCPYWTVRDTVNRWCHQAGVSSETFHGNNRISREHILLRAPQPGTGRSITLDLTFRTRGEPSDHLTFTEEYRAPDEILGYSYAKAISYADLPALVAHLEGDGGVPGDPEDRLIRCFEQLLANGTLDPAAGQAAARDRVLSWITSAGLRELSGYRGFDRRETLLQVPLDGGRQLSVSFSIDAYSKQLGFQEGYGSSTDKWRDALYQLQFPYSSAASLLTWLEARVEPPADQLSVDDRLVAAFRSLAERGELQPGRPMAVPGSGRRLADGGGHRVQELRHELDRDPPAGPSGAQRLHLHAPAHPGSRAWRSWCRVLRALRLSADQGRLRPGVRVHHVRAVRLTGNARRLSRRPPRPAHRRYCERPADCLPRRPGRTG